MILNGLYLIWKNIWANKRMHLFTIVQILLVVLLFNIVLSIIQNTRIIFSHYENSDFSRAIYAAQIPTTESREDTSVILNQVPLLLGVNEDELGIMARAGLRTPEVSANVILYNDRLLSSTFLPLAKGTWLQPDISSEGPIPVVISSDFAKLYDVGDVIPVEVASYISATSQQFLIEVAGILGKSSNYLSGSYWGTTMGLESIYRPAERIMIIPLNRPEFAELPLLYERGFFLFVDEDSDFTQTYNVWSEHLTDLVSMAPLAEMAQNHIEQIRYPITMYTSILVVLFFLALGGLGGNNALMLLGFRKEGSVYFTCGCKWSWCVIMLMIQNFLVLLIPTVVSFVILTNFPELFNDFMPFSTSNYLYSVLVIFFIYIVTSLDPLLSLAKESPISIIRRYD